MNPRPPTLRLRGYSLLFGLCCSAFAVNSTAQTLSAPDKLAAIRQQLVQAALDGPTHVQSTQWIDGQGTLRESSSFRSGMKIRGIRVLSYGQDEQGKPSAQVEWKTLPPQAAAAALAATSSAQQAKNCKPSESGRLHHVAALAWSAGSAWNADDLPLLLDFKSLFRAAWQRSSENSALWRLAETQAASERSAYQQALLASSSDDIPWKLQLTLEPVPSTDPQLAYPTGSSADHETASAANTKHKTLKLQLQMTLTTRLQNRPVLQLSTPLELEVQLNNWEPARLNQASRLRVSQQAQNWAQEIHSVLACLPVVAQVTQATPSHFRINAGAQAGVRVGDEWLLADGQKIPRRLLEADIASHTVLAKVQYVDQYHAQLQTQAGASRLVERNWSAWAAQE